MNDVLSDFNDYLSTGVLYMFSTTQCHEDNAGNYGWKVKSNAAAVCCEFKQNISAKFALIFMFILFIFNNWIVGLSN